MKRFISLLTILISLHSFIYAIELNFQPLAHEQQSTELEITLPYLKILDKEAEKPNFNPKEFEDGVLIVNDFLIESNYLTASGITLHHALNILNNKGFTDPINYNPYRTLIAYAELYLRGGDLNSSANFVETVLELFKLFKTDDYDGWLHNNYILTAILSESGEIERPLEWFREPLHFLKEMDYSFTAPTINAMLYSAISLEPHLTDTDISDIIEIVKKRPKSLTTDVLGKILLAKYGERKFQSHEKALAQFERQFETSPVLAYPLALPDALEAAWHVGEDEYLAMLPRALFYHQDDIINNMSAFSTNSSERAWDKKAKRFNRAFTLGLNKYTDNYFMLSAAWLNSVFYKSHSLQNIQEIWNSARNSKVAEIRKTLDNILNIRQKIASTVNTEEREKLISEADKLEWALRSTISLSNSVTKNQNKAVMAHKNLDPDECLIEIFEYPYFDKEAGEMEHFGAVICTAEERVENTFGTKMKVDKYEFVDLGPVLAWESLYNGLLGQFDNKMRAGNYSSDNILHIGNLFRPLVEKIEKYRRAYISPVGVLNSINIGAVPVSKNGDILNDVVEIIRINSAYDLKNLKQQGNALKSGAVFANINYSASSEQKANDNSETKSHRLSIEKGGNMKQFYSLPIDGDALIKAVNIKGGKLNFLSGVKASEEAFKKLDGKAPELIHLDSHGFYIPEGANMYLGKHTLQGTRESALLTCGLPLAGANHAWKGEEIPEGKEDGILTAWEISCMDLSNCKLAVLSACETAAGENDPINGVLGLQRALKIAGVQSMLLTLWPVDNELTQEFINDFYSRLPKSKDFNDAFVKTQHQFRLRHPDPYHWAPFILIN